MNWKVYFYVPNLIGYLRVILVLYGFLIAQKDYQIFFITYLLSFIGDLFDGYFARLLNQSSKFGALLDMVTDRCATLGLLIVLALLYPENSYIFIYLAILDISSHWFHMICVYIFNKDGHHKNIKKSNNIFQFFIYLYYSYYYFFGYLCVGNELYYLILYLNSFSNEINSTFPMFESIYNILYYPLLVACVLKNFINVIQLINACNQLTDFEKLNNKAKK